MAAIEESTGQRRNMGIYEAQCRIERRRSFAKLERVADCDIIAQRRKNIPA
jgi:hypothetical protein